jgi:hypothetical protein
MRKIFLQISEVCSIRLEARDSVKAIPAQKINAGNSNICSHIHEFERLACLRQIIATAEDAK